MTTNAKFEKWYYSGDGASTPKGLADKAWQAALSSLEVTPELVMLARSRIHAMSNVSVSAGSMRIVLEDIFAALKEGKA